MTDPTSLVEAAARHRRDLTRGRKDASERMALAYGRAQVEIKIDLDLLQARMRAARALGEPVSVAWLEREERYQRLLGTIGRELTAIAPAVASTIDPLVRAAVEAGQFDADELLRLGVPDEGFGVVNARAAVQAVGVTEAGPLADLLAVKVPGYEAAAAATLQQSVIRGWSPYRTARELRKVTTGMAYADAVTLARTEQMRIYRESTRQSYIANPAVESWIFLSRCEPGRTCAYCYAQHGKVFSVRRPMPTHPNCGCTMIPKVPDLDTDELLDGQAQFDKLTDAEQELALGGKAAKLGYDAGLYGLDDVIATRVHPEYGAIGGRKPLSKIVSPGIYTTLLREARTPGR